MSREYRSLEVRRQKAAGIDEYFGTTAGAAAVVALPDESVVKDATIASERGKNALSDSFPATQSLLGNEMVGPSDRLLEFQPGNYAVLDRVLLAQSSGLAVRLKWNFFTIAIHRSEPADKYRDFLQRLVGNSQHLDPVGTFAVPRGEGVEKALKADQFASTYLHGLAKLTTAEFLAKHEDILLSAFDATRLIVQPSLESSEGNVTPDFILEREDGTHVVGDLALPLRETGQKHRRSLDLSAGASAAGGVPEVLHHRGEPGLRQDQVRRGDHRRPHRPGRRHPGFRRRLPPGREDRVVPGGRRLRHPPPPAPRVEVGVSGDPRRLGPHQHRDDAVGPAERGPRSRESAAAHRRTAQTRGPQLVVSTKFADTCQLSGRPPYEKAGAR